MIDFSPNGSITEKQVAELRRLFVTLFKINRVSESFKELDVNNIKATFKIDQDLFSEFERFVRTELSTESELIDLVDLNITPFGGPTNGPNGVPKLESAPMEAYALIQNKDGLIKYFTDYCHVTSNQPFLGYLESVAEVYKNENPNANLNKIKLRKLTAVTDSGNKSRVIAICDY